MGTILTDIDKQTWQSGKDDKAYEYLGARLTDEGAHFAVWAPRAHSVSVVGSFNDWDNGQNPMKKDKATGIWATFIPGVEEGALYKYELKAAEEAAPYLKADPYAYAAEMRPKMASRVYSLDGFAWDDAGWMKRRREIQSFDKPISIYEVHLGSWKRKGEAEDEHLSYRELAQKLIPYVKKTGFTHIELMPVAEHPYDPSWGYQITGYFAPTSRFGEPKDFMFFVNECHKNDIGIILDWVPGHFPKDEQGLQMFDGAPLYEYSDPKKREQKDWGTYIFDYGKAGVRNFLLSNARFWCDRFHIDGLRVDAVASMLYLDYSKNEEEWSPNKYGGNEHLEAIQFLKDFNQMVHQEFPGVLTFAEESSSWPGVTLPTSHGGLGFDYKWNMGWMNDTLEYIRKNSGERDQNPENITFPMMYNENENFLLPLSHDEVVHLKKPLLLKSPVAKDEQFANLRLLLTYLYAHPGKKLLFMGGEFAETREWSENRALQWSLLERDRHRGVKKLVEDLNSVYCGEPSLYSSDRDSESFEWIEPGQRFPSFFAFKRISSQSNHLLGVFNFSDRKVDGFGLDPFRQDQYQLILNSDSGYYGGQNRGGHAGSGKDQTIWMPPYSAFLLKPEN